jgi:hypothetical protein
MTDINQYITDYLDYYCGLENAPGFAVLLKGEWGSGKTSFIKRYCKSLREQKRKCLYVSLNGVTSFSEIEEAFLQQQIPFLASKPVAIGRNLITQVLKNSLKLDVNDAATLNLTTPSMKLTELFTNLEQSILIFDDLERCSIDIVNRLGYINSFVEQKGLKVIIIANEDKIFENYKDIKEKLIGKTFNISPDIYGSLNAFIEDIKDLNIQGFFIKNIEFMKKLYEQAKCSNLRILKQIILDFERIYEKLDDKGKNKQEVLQEIIQLLTIFSIEIKMANMQPTDITKLLDAQVDAQARRNRSMKNGSFIENNSDVHEDKNNLQEICDKYYYLQIYYPFPSAIWWEDFFDKGVVNIEELNNEIINKYFPDENTPNWLKLYYHNRLSDDKFDSCLKIVESEFISCKYTDISIIKHIIGLFLYFSEKGLYSKDKEEILKAGRIHIDNLISKNQLNILELMDKNILDNSIGSAGSVLTNNFRIDFYSRDKEDFKNFCYYINEALNKELLNAKYMGHLAQEVLQIMKSDITEFYDMICVKSYGRKNIKHKYDKIPILKYIHPQDFVITVLSMDMDFDNKKHIFWALNERYELINVDVYRGLVEELDWLKAIQKLFFKEANKRQGKLSGFQIRELIENNLYEVISKLENIQIQQININKSLNQDFGS